MNSPGSLCPSVKASEIIGDKWILLILRELFFGSTRYNQFQRAMPRISPTVLSGRLKQMEQNGLLIHKKIAGQKGGEYRLTQSAKELAPIVDGLAKWGLRWARDQLCDADLDVGGFMWDFHRTLNIEALPDGQTVLCVILNDQSGMQKWWLVADDGTVDLCNSDPGFDVDVYVSGGMEHLAAMWMGDVSVKSAIQAGDLKLTGASYLLKSVDRWFPKSHYADVRPVEQQGS